MEAGLLHAYYVTKQICTSRLVAVALTHTRTQFLWVHLYCSHNHQHDLHDHFVVITVLFLLHLNCCSSVLCHCLLTDCFILRVCAKTTRDLKHISVVRRCGCALLYLPKLKPVLSQFLERGVFICHCAVGSECESVCALQLGDSLGGNLMKVSIWEDDVCHYNWNVL
jgi:hypothetical protein